MALESIRVQSLTIGLSKSGSKSWFIHEKNQTNSQIWETGQPWKFWDIGPKESLRMEKYQKLGNTSKIACKAQHCCCQKHWFIEGKMIWESISRNICIVLLSVQASFMPVLRLRLSSLTKQAILNFHSLQKCHMEKELEGSRTILAFADSQERVTFPKVLTSQVLIDTSQMKTKLMSLKVNWVQPTEELYNWLT